MTGPDRLSFQLYTLRRQRDLPGQLELPTGIGLPALTRFDAARWRDAGLSLAEPARRLARRGLRLAFHHHAHEAATLRPDAARWRTFTRMRATHRGSSVLNNDLGVG